MIPKINSIALGGRDIKRGCYSLGMPLWLEFLNWVHGTLLVPWVGFGILNPEILGNILSIYIFLGDAL